MPRIRTQVDQPLLSPPHLVDGPPEVGVSSVLSPGPSADPYTSSVPFWASTAGGNVLGWVSGARAVSRSDQFGIQTLALTGCVTSGESFQISDTQVSAGCNCLPLPRMASHEGDSPLDLWSSALMVRLLIPATSPGGSFSQLQAQVPSRPARWTLQHRQMGRWGFHG